MKAMPLVLVILLASAVRAQTATRQQVPAQSPSPQLQQSAPRDYAVMFVPASGEGLAFFKAPNGSSGVVPVSKVNEAFSKGYKPVTVGDLSDGAASYAQTIQDLQKKLNDLSSDYEALVARYNRLAEINSVPQINAYAPPQETSQQAEKRAMRLMLFQSLLSRNAPPVQVQVTDCTRYPALCVH